MIFLLSALFRSHCTKYDAIIELTKSKFCNLHLSLMNYHLILVDFSSSKIVQFDFLETPIHKLYHRVIENRNQNRVCNTYKSRDWILWIWARSRNGSTTYFESVIQNFPFPVDDNYTAELKIYVFESTVSAVQRPGSNSLN